jgi:hypothetical protein
MGQIGERERQEWILLLAVGMERDTAGHQHLDVWCPHEERGRQWRCREQTLEVVQHQEETLVADRRTETRCGHVSFAHTQHAAHRGSNQTGFVERAQVDEPDAIGEVLQDVGGDLQGETGFPHAAGTGDGQQADSIAPEEVDHIGYLLFPAKKRCRLQGQIIGAGRERPDREEVGRQTGMEQLEDPLGSVQIAQRMFTEVAQSGSWRQCVPGKILGGEREEDLTAVRRRQQTGQTVQTGAR